MEQTIAWAPAAESPPRGEIWTGEAGRTKRILDFSTSPALTVEMISDAATFFGMEDAWNALAQAAHLDHPFLTHAWIRSWWEAFGSANTLHILAVREDGRLIGIAPLMRTRRKFFGMPLRCVEFIANVHSPRQDFLIACRRDEVIRAIWTRLLQHEKLWDVLLLSQITSDSPTVDLISRMAEHERYSVGLWPSADSPYLMIEGAWEDQFKRFDGKHRQNLRRRLKRLSEVGPVEMQRVTGGPDLGIALDDGLRIEGAAWKEQEGTSIRSCPQTRQFYTKLAERFADRGWLDLNFLTVAGRRIAFNYCVRYENKIYLLKPGYDPELANYSPVNLLCYLSLQEAFAAGATEFDFLGIEDEWKREWTRTKRSHVWLYVFSKSPWAVLVFLAKFRLGTILNKWSVSRRVLGLWRGAAPEKA